MHIRRQRDDHAVDTIAMAVKITSLVCLFPRLAFVFQNLISVFTPLSDGNVADLPRIKFVFRSASSSSTNTSPKAGSLLSFILDIVDGRKSVFF